MPTNNLNTLEEYVTLYGKENADLKFGKLKDNRYGLILDYRGVKERNKLFTFLDKMPILLIIDNQKDLQKLKKIENTVDTKFLYGLKAKKLIDDMKILSTGKAEYYAYSPDTIVIKKIQIDPFIPNTILVIRLDRHNLTDISKTTREFPAEVYFKKKGAMTEDRKLSDTEAGQTMIVGAIGAIIVSIVMLFIMVKLIALGARRDKNLERRIKDVLKDGKKWEVYIVKDEMPNAFCIIHPRIFITSGLMKMLTEDEVVAVMLHEAGHLNNRDIWKQVATEHAISGTIIASLFVLPFTSAGMALFFLFFVLCKLSQIMIRRGIGRKHETRADSYAVKYGYADQMSSALTKIEKWVNKELSKRPCGPSCKLTNKINDYLDEHPPFKERLESILKEKETWSDKTLNNMKSARDYFFKKFKIEKDQ